MSWGVDDQFRLWLRAGMTGCEFARLLAGKHGGIAVELHVSVTPPATWLNRVFDAHASAGYVVVAVFPNIVTEAALIEFLNALQATARWKLRRSPKVSPSGGVLVGVEWTTRSGDISDVMGFAPFPTMPVPRRSPYVAIATWPGGRSNPFRGIGSTPPGRQGIVSFLDASHGLDHEAYEDRWKKTSERVGALMSIPPDDARLYRRTTFVLTAEQADKLAVAAA
jgi:hypothetical protein